MAGTILFTLMGLDIGGAESHAVVLARHLTELGYRVVFASNGGCYQKDIAAMGLKHYQLPLHQRNWRNLAGAGRDLRRVIKQEHIQLIHAHGRIPAFVSDLARIGTGIPLLTTAHALNTLSLPLRYFSRWGERTIAVSADIRQHLIQNYGVPAEKIVVIPNGIDVELFHPASGENLESAPSARGLRVAYVSRLDNLLTPVALNLLTAVEQLAPDLPGLHLQLAGAGPGEALVARKVQEMNQQFGSELVRYQGAVVGVHRLLLQSEIVVGVSRVALEAMACGRNVLLAGGEGFGGLMVPEQLDFLSQDNFTGRQFTEKPTAENLRQGLLAFQQLPLPQREEQGRVFRQYVVAHYSSVQMAQATAAVYTELLKPSI